MLTTKRKSEVTQMNKDTKFEAQRIRAQYVETPVSELDELRALDARVKRPANVFGYTFGSVAAVVMGSGMSLIMTDIAAKLGIGADPFIPGIIIGAVGLLMAAVNYPIYKGILTARRKKFAPEIIALSEKIV